MNMTAPLRKGDRVSWNTPQGRTAGVVKKKLIGRTKIQGHPVNASKDEPQFLVESSRTGKRAAHKQAALKKR
jgi:hypothetical protein